MNGRQAWSARLSVPLALACDFLPAQAAPTAPAQHPSCKPIDVVRVSRAVPTFVNQRKQRTTADPAVVVFRGVYYLCATDKSGYRWSRHIASWNFVPPVFLTPEHRV